MQHISDPLEQQVAVALQAAGIKFLHETDFNKEQINPLDFYLTEFNIWIEIKRYYSERIIKQQEHRPNVIVLQGETAVRIFCALLSSSSIKVLFNVL